MTARANRTGTVRPRKARRAVPSSRRDRLATLLAAVTIGCLGSTFFLSRDTQFLMPGPLASAHGAIANCNACHTQSGSGKFSWIHGLLAGDPHADSKACLTCHKMPNTAFNPHGTADEVLKRSTERMTKIAASTPVPQWSRIQSMAFPTHDLIVGGLDCATCHQEHQGVEANLHKVANEKCQSCHAVKFDSFDGNHPKFDNYPFKRRTRIIYDHAGHFGKHFPEVAKKYPARRIPTTCSACHDSHDDKRLMAVAPFEQTCTACHLDQILGKERVSGPKGIAFLALPGLDLQTLKGKNVVIGEWPDASDAELTPFMKVMISRDQRGRDLLKTVDRLNLQDLTGADDDQIKAVTELVWAIKGLFYTLISGKASDVLADLNIGGEVKLSPELVADLTANLPRDVVISAQQQWLPNLAIEMLGRGSAREENQSGWNTAITATGSVSPEPADLNASQTDPSLNSEAVVSQGAEKAKLDPPVCTVRIFGQCLVSQGQDGAASAKAKAAETEVKTDKVDAANSSGDDEAAPNDQARSAETEGLNAPTGTDTAADDSTSSADEPSLSAQPEPADASTDTAATDDGEQQLSEDIQPQIKGADQTDDLLSPTAAELRAINTAETAARSKRKDGPGGTDNAGAESQAATLLASIEGDVDSETWAEYGGWYRQDYTIFYRPTGHKDKFIYAWLSMTGPRSAKGDTSPASSVFDSLTAKDAQGSCTKCHSVDDLQRKGRIVNFSPASVDSKQGRFTNFIHQPHFQALGLGQRIGLLQNLGCLTCHDLEKNSSYLKSYEQGNPQNLMSNFGAIKKDLCQTCHNSSTARQDCLLCHTYHVKGVTTPIMSTKIPTQ